MHLIHLRLLPFLFIIHELSLLHFTVFPATADVYRAKDSLALLEIRYTVLKCTAVILFSCSAAAAAAEYIVYLCCSHLHNICAISANSVTFLVLLELRIVYD